MEEIYEAGRSGAPIFVLVFASMNVSSNILEKTRYHIENN